MTASKQHIVLKTEQLSIGYKTKKETSVIVSDINIELNSGELIGLVGANGIGKSTLLRTLTKVQPKLSGSIFLNNILLDDYTNLSLAKTMGLVLTEQIASKNLSVFEIVALGRQPYTNWVGKLSEMDLSIIERSLNETNLEDIKHKKCFELSDGQFQKVMIARALAQDTDLIILDEPTTHLDMYHKAYILKLLQRLAKDNQKTILFSSHEIDLSIQLCDTMIVMSDNSVVSNSPCNLIEQGVFSNLFPKNMISFDASNGSFRIKK